MYCTLPKTFTHVYTTLFSTCRSLIAIGNSSGSVVALFMIRISGSISKSKLASSNLTRVSHRERTGSCRHSIRWCTAARTTALYQRPSLTDARCNAPYQRPSLMCTAARTNSLRVTAASSNFTYSC